MTVGCSCMSEGKPATFWSSWRERGRALRNIPALLHIVWASGHTVVAASLTFRIIAALVPFAMLAVTKQILDGVQHKSSGGALPDHFWGLVALEGGLAVLGSVLGRAIGFFDALFADRFTRHVSVRVMEHASRLDLTSYENPAFHDKLERARVQATDRIAMIHAMGDVVQQAIIATSLSLSILYFSPWLLVLLVLAVVPAFLGESHFAFLGYSLNISQTPVRRQLDYLRVLGASRESAKELKLFGLSSFVTVR
jgi:ATP-binding cassette subfamily B protein